MRDNTAIADGLRRLLCEAGTDTGVQVVSCEAMTGGYSRVMTKACLRWDDGREQTLVLRADPLEDETVYLTDRRVEWEILRALTDGGTVPTPAARFYDDGRHLGTRTIVLDFCEGPSLQRVLTQLDARGGTEPEAPSSTEPDFGAWGEQVARTLATIHRTPWRTVHAVLAEPPPWEAYVDGLIEEWDAAERAHVESVPVLRYLAAWLRAHRPPATDYVLVHGDFQVANLLAGEGDLQIIDWEFAHVGDPREDIGWFNIYASACGAPNVYALDPGRFLGAYRSATGVSAEVVNEVTVTYFSVLAATRVYLDVLRSAAAMAEGRAHGTMLTYTLNALAVGNGNWLDTCVALAGQL